VSDSALHAIPAQALEDLADALEIGSVAAPYTALGVRHYAATGGGERLAEELHRLASLGMTGAQMGALLRLLVGERRSTRHAGGSAELVWTGPEVVGSMSRDTRVVVDELFARARRSVIVSSYSIHDGKAIFRRLIENSNADPALAVRMFLNIPRASFQKGWSGEALVAHFAERFRALHWDGPRLPEVFYDPRSLDEAPETKGVLHAKCVLVDDVIAFVTSANFSEAAQTRNIEAGILLENAALTRSLRRQFETLVSGGALVRLPLPTG
jgi:hypothetical protein